MVMAKEAHTTELAADEGEGRQYDGQPGLLAQRVGGTPEALGSEGGREGGNSSVYPEELALQLYCSSYI